MTEETLAVSIACITFSLSRHYGANLLIGRRFPNR